MTTHQTRGPQAGNSVMRIGQPEWWWTLAAGVIHVGSEKVIADALVTGDAALKESRDGKHARDPLCKDNSHNIDIWHRESTQTRTVSV